MGTPPLHDLDTIKIDGLDLTPSETQARHRFPFEAHLKIPILAESYFERLFDRLPRTKCDFLELRLQIIRGTLWPTESAKRLFQVGQKIECRHTTGGHCTWLPRP